MDQIAWKNNLSFPSETTIAQAIVLGTSGQDDGLRGCGIIGPTTNSCPDWLNYMCYLEMMYERLNHGIIH